MDWMLVMQALIGLAVFVLLALPFSSAPRGIQWRLVGVAILLQIVICFLLLKVPVISAGFAYLTQAVNALSQATQQGTTFIFGYLGGGPTPFEVTNPNAVITFAFQLLPLVIVMSALSALLWYWGVLPLVVKAISRVFEKTLGTRGPAGLAAAANVFVGQVEAPLLVKPYIARMTRYELLLLMTAGMATIAGSVMVIYASMLGNILEGALGHLLTKSLMSVPAAIVFSHLLLPELPTAESDASPPRIYGGSMDAVTQGTSDGLNVYLGILAMLLVLITFVAIFNSFLGLLPEVGGAALSLERVAGWVFAPIAWCMGIPWSEAPLVGSLLGIKTILNEFIAFIELSNLPAGSLSDRSQLIATYGLCGFANISSMGILIAGIGALCPERKLELGELAPKALLAATLGTCMAGSVVAIVAG
ncbi:MAG: NupC/NupG family nucleoside CNT transporter [Steroidobacteraceae bacterium]